MEKYNIQMKCGQALNSLHSPFFFTSNVMELVQTSLLIHNI